MALQFVRFVGRKVGTWWHRERVPITVKVISREWLRELMAENTRLGRGANGRPAWFEENYESIERLLLVPFGPDRLGLRCNAVVFRAGWSHWIFSVDLTWKDFDALPALSRRETTVLLGEFILRLPVLPLDPDQEASWRSAYPEVYPDAE